MMTNEERLDRALRALAEVDLTEAPLSVEQALRSTFRRRKRRRQLIPYLTAIAAALLVVFSIRWPRAAPPPHLKLPPIGVPIIAAQVAQPVRATPKHRRVRPRTELATRFYPLPDTAVSPFDYGTVIRVQLPRSTMRMVGLPVNENRLAERIDADVLVGQDGLARAVRFLQ